jgi:hypothetical protein
VSTIKKTNAKNAMKTINILVIGLLFSSAVSAQKFPLTVTYAAQNPVCYDESNGLIELFVNGGAAPYTYEWNDGSTAHFKSHIPAGTYDIMVRDAANIAVALSVTLTNPTPLEINGNITSVSSTGGNNGSIDLSLSGTGGSFEYEWTTNSGSGITPWSLDQTNLTAGSYTLTVTNASGCESSRTFIIKQPIPYLNPFNAITNTFVPHGGQAVQSIAYPNPSNGKVNFRSTNEVTQIAIYNTTGFLVETLENANQSVDLQTGNYTAVFTHVNGETTNERIIVR